MKKDASPAILLDHGNHEGLLAFQKAEIVYDITFRFCHRHLAKGDRTIDQMIQAARSGKKNLLEGSRASRASKETEIKLTNVARASLEELLDDHADYLRVRDHPLWSKDSRESLYIRRLGRRHTSSTVPSSKPVRRKPSPISPSASSTRPITSPTATSPIWEKTSSPTAASANA